MKEPFCEKASPKTLKERINQRIRDKMRDNFVSDVGDGFTSPIELNIIVDEEFEGFVSEFKKRLEQIDKRYVNKRSKDMAKLDLLDELVKALQ